MQMFLEIRKQYFQLINQIILELHVNRFCIRKEQVWGPNARVKDAYFDYIQMRLVLFLVSAAFILSFGLQNASLGDSMCKDGKGDNQANKRCVVQDDEKWRSFFNMNDGDNEKKENQQETGNALIPVSSGSGFAVSFLGHIVTNEHVIAGCSDIKVHKNGELHVSTTLSSDKINDLALIKVSFKPRHIFKLNINDAKLMEPVFVAGFPFGNQLSSSVKVTNGITSSLSGIGNNFSQMQITAALQPGNSGGPIFNKDGNILGVAVAKLALGPILEKFGTIPENTNFGIKGSVLKTFLKSNNVQFKEGGSNTEASSTMEELATAATFYLSCWMTKKQLKAMQDKKVIFNHFR